MTNIFFDDLTFYRPSWSLQWPVVREEGKEILGFSKTWVYITKLIIKKLSALKW